MEKVIDDHSYANRIPYFYVWNYGLFGSKKSLLWFGLSYWKKKFQLHHIEIFQYWNLNVNSKIFLTFFHDQWTLSWCSHVISSEKHFFFPFWLVVISKRPFWLWLRRKFGIEKCQKLLSIVTKSFLLYRLASYHSKHFFKCFMNIT